MSLGIKPTVDFAFKKIFGSPENVQVLIGLLNAILQLSEPIEQVTILNPFNYQEFANDKLIVLDIRARDLNGRWMNIEMQVSPVSGLLQRLVYYACSLYTTQLHSGDNYLALSPAISICLLSKSIFPGSEVAHHRFRPCDPEHGRELPATIEVHTVELSKYNLHKADIRRASVIEQWVFFLLYADQYDAEQLRSLLPGVEFQQAISVIETIAERTEDRMMYDQREKAQRDWEWMLQGTLQAGREEGREEGRQEGRQEGLQEGLQQGVERGTLAGKIQMLQQILGMEEDSLDTLRDKPLIELAAQLDELQQLLRSRGGLL